MSHLSLTSWRNYEQADLAFAPGPTVLLGANGQGKTNIVEAIAYLSTLKSHRLSQTAGLIRAGSAEAIIRARIVNGDREARLECQINATKANQAQIAGNSVKPRELGRYCQTVLFAPEDLSIVRGDPGERRSFIDDLIVALSPRMSAVFGDYDRVVKQRSNLLKTARNANSLSTLDIWDDKLIQLGSEIIRERERFVTRLADPVRLAYETIVGADHGPSLAWELSWGAEPGDDIERSFQLALEQVRGQEQDRGVTLVGPHRDELRLGLNTLPVKGYASHGESWSFALALKLAAAQLLRQDSQVGDPIVILDDVFAELDAQRRIRLTEAVATFEQVIVTAAVVNDVPEEFLGNVHQIRAGRIVEGEASA